MTSGSKSAHRSFLLRLALVSAVLVITAHWAAGDLAMPLMSRFRGITIVFLGALFGLGLMAIMISMSVVRVRQYADPYTRQVDLRALLSACTVPPVPGVLAMLIATWGITGVGNLTEIYRVGAAVWYDAPLWRLEAPLFRLLLGSWMNSAAFWDVIYCLLWGYLIAALAWLYWLGRLRLFHDYLLSAVLAFYLARLWALLTPAAGPVFFVPEFFDLAGTISAQAQQLLVDYMAGKEIQTGNIPGTTAMPSLHIGLTMLAVWYLAQWNRASLWLGLPWLALTWLSTLFLGWHYAVDGLAAVVVAGTAILLAHFLPAGKAARAA